MALTITLLDDFNRGNLGSLGANWGADTIGAGGANLAINSNTAVTDNSSYTENYYSASVPAADEGGGCTWTTLPSGASWSAGGMIRCQSPGSAACDGYRWQVDGTNATVIRVVNGAETVILANAHTANAGDAYYLVATGSGATITLKLYRIRSAVESVIVDTTDSNANRITAAGNVGLWAYDPNATAVFDDFSKAADAGSGDPYIGAGAAATAASGNVTPALPGSLLEHDILVLDITALDNVDCSVATSGGSGAAWTR